MAFPKNKCFYTWCLWMNEIHQKRIFVMLSISLLPVLSYLQLERDLVGTLSNAWPLCPTKSVETIYYTRAYTKLRGQTQNGNTRQLCR